MAKPRLRLYSVVPNLQLSSTEDRLIKLTDYKQQKNLILFFYNSGQCLSCLERLRAFSTNYDSYKRLNAEVLGISSDPVADSKIIKEEYRLPFPLLSDPEGRQMDRITEVVDGVATPSVFVIDRYGSLFNQWIISHEEGDLPEDKVYLQTLEYIEAQCPECGIFPEEESA